jgi:hypothetical protein
MLCNSHADEWVESVDAWFTTLKDPEILENGSTRYTPVTVHRLTASDAEATARRSARRLALRSTDVFEENALWWREALFDFSADRVVQPGLDEAASAGLVEVNRYLLPRLSTQIDSDPFWEIFNTQEWVTKAMTALCGGRRMDAKRLQIELLEHRPLTVCGRRCVFEDSMNAKDGGRPWSFWCDLHKPEIYHPSRYQDLNWYRERIRAR